VDESWIQVMYNKFYNGRSEVLEFMSLNIQVFWDAGNYLPKNMASYSRRLVSLSSLILQTRLSLLIEGFHNLNNTAEHEHKLLLFINLPNHCCITGKLTATDLFYHLQNF
jgi:hypothetical protein